MQIDDLSHFYHQYLQVEEFDDYCPNGLQVKSSDSVSRIVSGVTANQSLIEAAADLNADAILVHHGYFWKGENPCLVGYKGKRIATLIKNNISLLAYHLPLDAHVEVGNNAQLGLKLGWHAADQQGLLWLGELDEVLTADQVQEQVSESLDANPLLIQGGDRPVKTVAWCSGAAQSMIDKAVDAGVDLFLSGEISEQTVHVAREAGIHYIAAGHHATERYGVQALGELTAQRFGIEHQFVDIDNPV